jgi:hypothetical protein
MWSKKAKPSLNRVALLLKLFLGGYSFLIFDDPAIRLNTVQTFSHHAGYPLGLTPQ